MPVHPMAFVPRASVLVLLLMLQGCERSAPAPDPAPALTPATATATGSVPEPSSAPEAVPAPATAPEVAPEPAAQPEKHEDPPQLVALRKDMPPDAGDFIRRAVICNHWAGEEPYDEERRAQINAMVQELRCRELDADQASLRKQYAGNAEVLRRIRQSRSTPL